MTDANISSDYFVTMAVFMNKEMFLKLLQFIFLYFFLW